MAHPVERRICIEFAWYSATHIASWYDRVNRIGLPASRDFLCLNEAADVYEFADTTPTQLTQIDGLERQRNVGSYLDQDINSCSNLIQLLVRELNNDYRTSANDETLGKDEFRESEWERVYLSVSRGETRLDISNRDAHSAPSRSRLLSTPVFVSYGYGTGKCHLIPTPRAIDDVNSVIVCDLLQNQAQDIVALFDGLDRSLEASVSRIKLLPEHLISVRGLALKKAASEEHFNFWDEALERYRRNQHVGLRGEACLSRVLLGHWFSFHSGWSRIDRTIVINDRHKSTSDQCSLVRQWQLANVVASECKHSVTSSDVYGLASLLYVLYCGGEATANLLDIYACNDGEYSMKRTRHALSMYGCDTTTLPTRHWLFNHVSRQDLHISLGGGRSPLPDYLLKNMEVQSGVEDHCTSCTRRWLSSQHSVLPDCSGEWDALRVYLDRTVSQEDKICALSTRSAKWFWMMVERLAMLLFSDGHTRVKQTAARVGSRHQTAMYPAELDECDDSLVLVDQQTVEEDHRHCIRATYLSHEVDANEISNRVSIDPPCLFEGDAELSADEPINVTLNDPVRSSEIRIWERDGSVLLRLSIDPSHDTIGELYVELVGEEDVVACELIIQQDARGATEGTCVVGDVVEIRRILGRECAVVISKWNPFKRTQPALGTHNCWDRTWLGDKCVSKNSSSGVEGGWIIGGRIGF